MQKPTSRVDLECRHKLLAVLTVSAPVPYAKVVRWRSVLSPLPSHPLHEGKCVAHLVVRTGIHGKKSGRVRRDRIRSFVIVEVLQRCEGQGTQAPSLALAPPSRLKTEDVFVRRANATPVQIRGTRTPFA